VTARVQGRGGSYDDSPALAATAARLRGRAGRPRKAPGEGTGRAQPLHDNRTNGGVAGGAQDSESGRPTPLTERRLLDVPMLGAYLGGLGEDTVREMDASGVLTAARVRLPAANGRELRKVLFDREVIDRLVAGWRTPA
jgi:hypothetical protein